MSDLDALSAQLVSLNYLKRPLDLRAVFQPSKDVSASQAAQDARTREHFLSCIHAILSSRNASSEALERVDGALRVREYELERMGGMVEVEKRKAKKAEEEAKAEGAKARAAQLALTAEVDKHKHTRDELAKSKSALQALKVQAQLDVKRREAEMSATVARLQKITADSTTTKFTILNAAAFQNGPRAARPGTAANAADRQDALATAAAAQAEVSLLQDALETAEADRLSVLRENDAMREAVEEADEWAERMLDLRGVDDGQTTRGAGGVLGRKMETIHAGVSLIVDSVSKREELVREEMTDAVEVQRLGRAQERQKRVEVEKELEQEKERANGLIKLMDSMASDEFKAGAQGIDESFDDE